MDNDSRDEKAAHRPRFVVKRAADMIDGETWVNAGALDAMLKYRHGSPNHLYAFESLSAVISGVPRVWAATSCAFPAAIVDLQDTWHKTHRYQAFSAYDMNRRGWGDRKCYRFTVRRSTRWINEAVCAANGGPGPGDRSADPTKWLVPDRLAPWRMPHTHTPYELGWAIVDTWDGWDWVTTEAQTETPTETPTAPEAPPAAPWTPAVGDRVRRGPGWRWGDQDTVSGMKVVGTIVGQASSAGWWLVQWDGGRKLDYEASGLQPWFGPQVTPPAAPEAKAVPSWQWTPAQRDLAIVEAYEAKIRAVDKNVDNRRPWHCDNCKSKDEWPATFRACPMCGGDGPAKHFATSGVFIRVPTGPGVDDWEEKYIVATETKAAWSRVLRRRCAALPIDTDALVAEAGPFTPREAPLACDGTLPCDLIGHDVQGPPRGAVE